MTKLLKTKQVAELFNVSRPQVDDLVKSGDLSRVDLGVAKRFDEDVVNAYLQAKLVAAGLSVVKGQADIPKLIKTKQVAEMLNVSIQTIYTLVKIGDLKRVNLGGAYRFSEDAIESYLKAKLVGPKNKGVE